MAYRIFLSHAFENLLIAQEVRSVINDAFGGRVDVYMAAEELTSGDAWRAIILNELGSCDAIMTIATADAHDRPWMIAEWTVFWIAGKPRSVLLADGMSADTLFQPMQDNQATPLLYEADVRRLFAALNVASGREGDPPYAYVPLLIESVRAARLTQERQRHERSFAVYRDPARPLPYADREKEEIAGFFLAAGEHDHFLRVCRELRDDETRMRIAQRLLREGQVELLFPVAAMLSDAGRMQEIARRVVDAGLAGRAGFRSLVDDLARSQAEYRKLLLHLADRGEHDSPLFRTLAGGLTNMAEARKVAEHLVQNRKGFQGGLPVLFRLLGANRAELRKLALEMVANNLQRDPAFQDLLRILAGNQRETEKVMTVLFDHDRELFTALMASGLITEEAVLDRLNTLAA